MLAAEVSQSHQTTVFETLPNLWSDERADIAEWPGQHQLCRGSRSAVLTLVPTAEPL